MDQLTEHFTEIFDACAERGMQVPFILCAASPNGLFSVSGFTVTEHRPTRWPNTSSRKGFGRRSRAWSSTRPATPFVSPSPQNI
jgi:hypothetical protein